MGYALLELGFEVLGAREDLGELLENNKMEEVLSITERFDALQDVPWAILYKELDSKYPKSKFILTVRNDDNWIRSVQNHFSKRYIKLHEWIYGNGVAFGNEELYLNYYRKHNTDIQLFFKDRPDDLLIMNLENGDGWEKLCPFLQIDEVPSIKFPTANKGKHNRSYVDKTKRVIKSIMPIWMRKMISKTLFSGTRKNPFNNQIENRRYRLNNKKNRVNKT